MRRRIIRRLGPKKREALLHDWRVWANAAQIPPDGDWRFWLIMGGRGAGKTRAGAEWLRAQAESGRRGRFALVGATLSDVREVMVGGESGLIAIAPKDMRPHYEVSRRRLVWPNGAEARAFSAEDPDSLRGPQFDAAWCDEFAAWAKNSAALTVLDMALRIGADPRAVITTTPKPTPAMRNLLRMNGLVLSKASTTDNAANLAPRFLHSVTERYGGTDMARQELDGEMIEDLPGAVFRQAWIRRVRPNEMPELRRIVVAVDPPAGGGPNSDECGIVVAGATYDGEPRGYVLADWSFRADGPDDWARRARWGGDGWDGADPPLSEDAEAYEIRILDGSVIKRRLSANTPSAIYDLASQTADWGAAISALSVEIAQISARAGAGTAKKAVFPAL